MRLNSLSLRGITRFANTVSVNFNTLPAGLIALVGANGEGKTTIMESIAAALFRLMPSRDGALPNHCQGRDAFIELDFEHGGAHLRSLLKVDAQTGTQEAYLFNGDGNAALTNGKVKDFDAAIAERVTTPAIFLASVFASQNRKGNFMELSKADRKDLMIRMLGLEDLQRISDLAGERAKILETAVALAKAKVVSLQEQLEGLDDLRAKLGADEAALAGAQEDLEAARANLAAHIEQEAKLKAEAGRLASVQQSYKAVTDEIAQLATKRQDMVDRRKNNADLLANAEEVRGAAAMVALLEQSIEAKRTELATAESHRDQLLQQQDEARALQDAAAATDQEYERLMRVVTDARAAINTGLQDKVFKLKDAVSMAHTAIATATGNVRTLQAQITALKSRTPVLEQIPCGDSFPSCSLIADAVSARDSIPALEAKVADAEQGLAGKREQWAALDCERIEAETALNTSLATPIESSPEASAAQIKAALIRKEAAQKTPAPEAFAAARATITRIQDELRHAETAIASARKTAERLPRLDAAETRIAELDQEIAQLDQESATKGQQANQLIDELHALPKAEDLAQAARVRAVAESTVRDRESTITNLQGSAAATRARITDLEALEPELATQRDLLEAKLEDLAQLKGIHRAFGKDGIQALEIDAAGPEVSALINELLCSCFGPRFTLSFETTRPKADGKGEREVFDIRIIDNERGRQGEIGTMSGGEKVILNEAISLALAIYNTRRSGKHFETLFRDETAGALDPVNADRYLRMLRRALELGGFHQLIFIAHQEDLWQAADARVMVRDGQAEVA